MKRFNKISMLLLLLTSTLVITINIEAMDNLSVDELIAKSQAKRAARKAARSGGSGSYGAPAPGPSSTELEEARILAQARATEEAAREVQRAAQREAAERRYAESQALAEQQLLLEKIRIEQAALAAGSGLFGPQLRFPQQPASSNIEIVSGGFSAPLTPEQEASMTEEELLAYALEQSNLQLFPGSAAALVASMQGMTPGASERQQAKEAQIKSLKDAHRVGDLIFVAGQLGTRIPSPLSDNIFQQIVEPQTGLANCGKAVMTVYNIAQKFLNKLEKNFFGQELDPDMESIEADTLQNNWEIFSQGQLQASYLDRDMRSMLDADAADRGHKLVGGKIVAHLIQPGKQAYVVFFNTGSQLELAETLRGGEQHWFGLVFLKSVDNSLQFVIIDTLGFKEAGEVFNISRLEYSPVIEFIGFLCDEYLRAVFSEAPATGRERVERAGEFGARSGGSGGGAAPVDTPVDTTDLCPFRRVY